MNKHGNMFDNAVSLREKEQAKVTAAVTGVSVPVVKEQEKKKPVKKEKEKEKDINPKTKITLSITPVDSDRVKMYALRNHTTVSDLLHEWIEEKCGF